MDRLSKRAKNKPVYVEDEDGTRHLKVVEKSERDFQRFMEEHDAQATDTDED